LATKEFSVRLGQNEIGHILNLKGNLDHHGQLCDHIFHYKALGFDLTAVTAQGEDLGLDLKQPQEQWWKQLMDLGLHGVQVNLGIRTGGTSRLLVLEVDHGGGPLSLDLAGDWRAQCVAELGDGREQHYYSLPADIKAPPSFFQDRKVLIYGEEGLVLAPPSIDPEDGEAWRWLIPPWQRAPQAPKPTVWQYLREHLVFAAIRARQAPPWETIYRLVAPYEAVLKALLVPPSTMEKYYGDIVQAALESGLKDRQAFLGLLWHAPHGDVRHNPDRWQNLQNLLVNSLPDQGEVLPVPVVLANGDAWPDWGPPPESPVVAGCPMESLDLTWGEGKLQQFLGDLQVEPCLTKFARSVSGQFFQLLAALGEKVIAESCCNEAVLSGGRRDPASRQSAADVEPGVMAGDGKTASPLPENRGLEDLPWSTALAPQGSRSWELWEVKAMVRDFLNNNPDLTGDRIKVQMVLFSLKNYVSINPEYAGLSFQDKLELAGQMARSFLDTPAEPR